jgi:hypothetical protein
MKSWQVNPPVAFTFPIAGSISHLSSIGTQKKRPIPRRLPNFLPLLTPLLRWSRTHFPDSGPKGLEDLAWGFNPRKLPKIGRPERAEDFDSSTSARVQWSCRAHSERVRVSDRYLGSRPEAQSSGHFGANFFVIFGKIFFAFLLG